MNTETLVNTNKDVQQPNKSIELSVLPTGKNEAERASCGGGVCEVAWKPYGKSDKTRRSNKKSGA